MRSHDTPRDVPDATAVHRCTRAAGGLLGGIGVVRVVGLPKGEEVTDMRILIITMVLGLLSLLIFAAALWTLYAQAPEMTLEMVRGGR